MPGLTLDALRGKTALAQRWKCDAGDYVAALGISKDGRLAIAGAGDGQVLGIELETGCERFRHLAHEGGVFGVSLSHDGTQFATCGQEPNAKLWSANGDLLRELPGGGAQWVEHVSWAPSGGRIATAAGRKVRVWTSSDELPLEIEPLPSTVSDLAWRADGTALAATCYGGVYIWPFVSGAKARRLEWKGSLISLAWSPDAKVIACGSQDNSVHFWRLASGNDSQMSGYLSKPKALAWDSESKLLATAGDSHVTVWDFRGKGPEGTRPIHLEGHKKICTRLAFSPRKGVLASGSLDPTVLLWEPRRGTQPTRYAHLKDEVTALAWHPEHLGLLGGDASGHLCFWDVN